MIGVEDVAPMNTAIPRPRFALGVDARDGIALVESHEGMLRMRYGECPGPDALPAAVLRIARAPEVMGRLAIIALPGTQAPDIPVTYAEPGELLEALWTVLREDRLAIAAGLGVRAELERQLAEVRAVVSAAGCGSASTRPAGGLVTALALACWWLEAA
jgi:hypothetical protein